MNINDLFKKKYVFKKPIEELGVLARPKWSWFVGVFIIVFITSCAFAYYVFTYTTDIREGVYIANTNTNKKIDSGKSAMVLELFKQREEKTNLLKTTPTVFTDPSR